MKRHYEIPSLEIIQTLSGGPFCGSTGEGFISDLIYPGLDGWTVK